MKSKYSWRWTRYLVTFCTFVVVFLPFVFFLTYHFKYYLDNNLIAISILTTCLGTVTFVLFIATALSNPGYLKRQDPPNKIYDALKHTYRTTNPPRYVDTMINGQQMKLKYCITCHIYRPPRSVHCSDCDKCIIKFDHHCPYVANCIGYYNYKIFLFFVFICCIYYCFLLGTLIFRSVEFFPQFPGNISENPIDIVGTIVFMIIVFLSIWVVFALFLFHLLIISKNMSTYDKLKEHFEEFNPFDRGVKNNYKALCYNFPKRSKIHRYSLYQPHAMYNINVEEKPLGETQ